MKRNSFTAAQLIKYHCVKHRVVIPGRDTAQQYPFKVRSTQLEILSAYIYGVRMARVIHTA